MPKVICEGCDFFNGMGLKTASTKEGEYHEVGYCQNRKVREEQLSKRGAVLWGQGTDGRGDPMKRFSKTPRYCSHRRSSGESKT